MISSISINQDEFKEYATRSKEEKVLEGIGKINVFIGANNSGKSRFLRKLFRAEFPVQITEFDSNRLANEVDSMKREALEYLEDKKRNQEIAELYRYIEKIPDVRFMTSGAALKDLVTIYNISLNFDTSTISDGTGIHPQVVASDVRQKLSRFRVSIEDYSLGLKEELLQFSKSYIPVLRGLKPLQINGQSFDINVNNYLTRIRSDYGFDGKATVQNSDIYTGLDLYTKVKGLLLGDSKDRQNIRKFEEYLGVAFFNNQEVNIVPRIEKDVLHIKIGNEEYPIYDLGDGIQSIILLTYPLFFNAHSNMLFFIEEPETHLHPGLQRIFIETLRNPLFKRFQYFFTTHSNHFLDLTMEFDDISVYTFQKEVKDNSTQLSIENVNSNHKHVLELIGVRNSSVFLSNCTIWIEGVTDRLYIRKILEILQGNEHKFKEDFHYSFIEYAGNNITHWSFLENDDNTAPSINVEGICSKIFLIVDNDGVGIPHSKDKNKKQARQEQLLKKLGENLYITKGLEIENLLTKDVVRKVIEEMEGANKASLDFSSFNRRDFSLTHLGKFIEETVVGIKRKYSSDYGTIHNKVAFCKKALKYMNVPLDLTAEAITLGKRILAFINASQ